MNNWQKVKLVDVADIKLSSVDKKTKAGEREVHLCNYTDVYKNAYINNDLVSSFMIASCSESDFEKFILKKGQVAITKDSEKTDDIGIPAYIAEDFENVVLGYHLSLITPNEDKLDGKFLNYWLKTNYAKRYFENNATGSGQRCTLVLDVIKSIPIYLPSLSVQKQIAKVLFDLETKIELNNKINAELEIIAKTIYDYWFIQFDFPDNHNKPYKSNEGEMKYNKTLNREIPIDWSVIKFDSIINQVTDTIHPEEFPELKYLPIDKLPTKKLYYQDYEDRSMANSSLIKFKEDDILLGAMRVYFHRVCNAIEDGISRSTMMVLRPINPLYKSFALFTLNRNEAIEYATKNSTGSSIPYAKWSNNLESYKFSIPSNLDLIERFNETVNPILEKFKVNSKENQKLAVLRDWLLPMLLNGQVTVKEAEEHINQEEESQENYS